MQRNGTLYTILFAAMVCGVCSILVSGTSVLLKDRQKANMILDRQRQVLSVAGLIQPGEKVSADEVRASFADSIDPKIVTLATGAYDDTIAVETFDQRRAAKDAATSQAAPENPAKVLRLPNHALVYLVTQDGALDKIVLPIEGKGLWSTLYGYLALDKDANTIRGITFYEHAETPGLGGEIDNPRWKALWQGRKAFDDGWKPAVRVIKGQAGPPEESPHEVDGLSGATLTGRGVTNLVTFWLGENGFGPYLAQMRSVGS
ncbi:MAG: Na(+)-translocating NADH-quinone reductase subunit C [Nitrospiraceae bacterium]|nr:Na(+)-translocating NADH-quinone reductase subunit C [Nitrospiraceae bacterium]